MSKIKNFDRALYESDLDAVASFIKEGHSDAYDFNVSTAYAFENALHYLCLNNIPHQYTLIHVGDISLITLAFGNNVEYSHSFFSTYREEDE